LKPEWWGLPLAQRRSTREERKPVTRDDNNYNNSNDDDDDEHKHELFRIYYPISKPSICS
jgi:hypothetical protein